MDLQLVCQPYGFLGCCFGLLELAKPRENSEDRVQERNRIYRIFSDHLPDDAVHYCIDLWVENPFDFVLSKKRQTKAGDYRFDPRTAHHRITVNADLNRFNFLITLIHEIAHQHATLKYGIQRPPHGQTWKTTFKLLMLPLLNNIVFPDDILAKLAKHMKNPKASSPYPRGYKILKGMYANLISSMMRCQNLNRPIDQTARQR